MSLPHNIILDPCGISVVGGAVFIIEEVLICLRISRGILQILLCISVVSVASHAVVNVCLRVYESDDNWLIAGCESLSSFC